MRHRIDAETMALVEARAREEWQSDAVLREEFLNDQESFLAYSRAVAMGVTPHAGRSAPAKGTGSRSEFRVGECDHTAVTAEAESVWRADPAIRAEFGEYANYLHFRLAEARGLVHRRTGIV
jgi:hypothetical protein